MNKAKKIMMFAVCAVLLVCISVGATLAYLTDTEAVTNTFTVGQVDISLAETPLPGGSDKGNSYHLIPGQSYTKDPTITVNTGSEDCYVVAKVVVTGAANLDQLIGYTESDGKSYIGFGEIVSGGIFTANSGLTYKTDITAGDKTISGWENTEVVLTQEKATNGDYVLYVYYKNAKNAGSTLKLFETIKVPDKWNNAEMDLIGDNMKINVSAYAVQKTGFDNVFAAFASGDAQGWVSYPATNP